MRRLPFEPRVVSGGQVPNVRMDRHVRGHGSFPGMVAPLSPRNRSTVGSTQQGPPRPRRHTHPSRCLLRGVSHRERPAVVARHLVSEPSGTSGKELVCRTVISPGEGFIISSTKTFNFHRHLLFALIVSIGHNVALASNFGLFTLFRS